MLKTFGIGQNNPPLVDPWQEDTQGGTKSNYFKLFFVVLGLTEEKKQILEDYHKTHNDEIMDINLLISLISDIHQKTDLTEAILVFLPGYEEIVNVKENLEHNVSNMKICMLHSQLNSRDQKQAFAKFRNDRKVVLATNIAETSLTIDDVTVVIDAGKNQV